MNITVNLQLMEGDVMESTPAEVADVVFRALDADESKDFCQVTITQPAPPPGFAGTMPLPPPPEE